MAGVVRKNFYINGSSDCMKTNLNVNRVQGNLSGSRTSTAGKIFSFFNIKPQSNDQENVIIGETEMIIRCLKEAYDEWQSASRNFDYADSEELVDYYTYKIKASEIRYQYFLRKAKEAGLRFDSVIKTSND